MAVSKNDKITQEFLETVESTNNLVNSLITDLRSRGVVDLVTLKQEVSNLVKNIEKVADSLDKSENDITDLKVKVAILENSLKELEILKNKDEKFQVVNKTGRWNVLVAVISSLTALAITIFNVIMNLVSK